MASVSDPFIAHCLEMLAPLGGIRSRRMFSGYGIYASDVFVAIVLRETLFLKVDDPTRATFQAAGGVPFKYDRDGKAGELNFWTVPPEAMESPASMMPWARLALAAGLRARAAKPAARKRAAKKSTAKKATAKNSAAKNSAAKKPASKPARREPTARKAAPRKMASKQSAADETKADQARPKASTDGASPATKASRRAR